ncbi:MAG: RNA-binding transcriptional accessory protein [Sphingobacteriales bacterium]|nr:MAG: RNA-binding transcriptional accessory protein [Sphingobacteriales bacterium]
MANVFASTIAQKLNIAEKSINSVLDLLAEGATIPFIARYRKDVTGAMDEVQIQQIQEEAKFRQEFSDRKAFIEKTINEQGKMTEALQASLDKAVSLNELEDIYLPYKPKRKTKAQTARENGLEPLALWLLAQNEGSVEAEAAAFVTENVADSSAALQGARDIIAETINEDASVRAQMRKLFEAQATVQSKVLTGQEEAGAKYKDYFEFSEPVSKIPSHRMLAIMRGFMEGILRMSIAPEEEVALEKVGENFIKASNEAGEQVKKAVRDAYRRLLQPSLESEFRMELKVKSDEEAITVFAENLRQLLLSSPLGSKRILAIDPGYRTGCKVVVIDEKGDLKHNDLIYVHENNFKLNDAEHKVRSLVKQYDVQAFAIGDGTAGRETEQFVKKLQLELPIFLVNEDGASVYSASATAREEFPDYDVTVRGAVSIGRRLMDPLAELVKIDPKSIGVGQYQHDVNQTRLKEKLDQTVESCVNTVGVNLNTAGKHLLSYVSGIGASVADNIVKYRSENGQFTDRKQLLKVPRLGNKAFEQCAGFLRIKEATHPLDASGVHPEAYPVVEQMAKDVAVSVRELIGNEDVLKTIKISNYVSDTIGKHTLEDILKELRKPGLDPRSELEQFEYANIYSIEDVQVGMEVPGIVTNLTRFGAFVDIGVKQDGLVHVSEISHTYISDPSEALKLNDKVKVVVTEIDLGRKRIALSIKQALPHPGNQGGGKRPAQQKRQAEPEHSNINDALSFLKSKFKK